MGKGKKKHSKKEEVTEDILDVAAISVRKFRKVTKEIHKLSTGQKIVGGLALVAAGLAYLAKQESDAADKQPAASAPTPAVPQLAFSAEAQPAAKDAADAPTKPTSSHKSRKPAKTKHDS
ncbi:MAG TPA: hypothetical protein VF629_10140 [Hymenobacter sp.]|jgi:hypothetical protein|uniref:hypothetical protein n=1 Tax=Hymenobacter sp. TaxID=1898978 RepID=UPI002EDB274F